MPDLNGLDPFSGPVKPEPWRELWSDTKDWVGCTIMIYGLKLLSIGVGLLTPEAFRRITKDWDKVILGSRP